jgi:hypothetical protein
MGARRALSRSSSSLLPSSATSLPGQTGFHLDHFFRLHAQRLRYLPHFGRVQRVAAALEAAQVEEELALRLGRGDLDQTPVAQDVFVDFRLDPVDGEGHQTHATVRVEALHRLHQADIAFLIRSACGRP